MVLPIDRGKARQDDQIHASGGDVSTSDSTRFDALIDSASPNSSKDNLTPVIERMADS
jgi:hypothetical protein